MSGILKALAAGAARGARDVSNANVDLRNREISAQREGDRDAQREALRHHYETERYKQKRKDKKEDLEQTLKAEQAGLLLKRKMKLEDKMDERAYKDRVRKEDHANARSIASIKQSRSAEKPHNRQKLAEYYVKTGKAGDLNEAEALIQEIELVKGAAGSGLFDVEAYLNKNKQKSSGDQVYNFDPEKGFAH